MTHKESQAKHFSRRRYLPIIFALFIVLVLTIIVVVQKGQHRIEAQPAQPENSIGTFEKQRGCTGSPKFLKQLKITQPVVIDLSQKRFKGVAMLAGRKFDKVLHPKQWERFGPMGTYTLDTEGNVYLAPIPFISIKADTFELQSKLYRIDTHTGKLSIWMGLDDVHPSRDNPYGIVSLVHDCDDGTLWVSALDESDFHTQKGVIYHIDPKTKKVIQKLEGFDALTLALIWSDKGKFLLLGSARDNGLYALDVKRQKKAGEPFRLLELPSVNEHIRKIKIKGRNTFELQSIPFGYSLVAQSTKQDRVRYRVYWDESKEIWEIIQF